MSLQNSGKLTLSHLRYVMRITPCSILEPVRDPNTLPTLP